MGGGSFEYGIMFSVSKTEVPNFSELRNNETPPFRVMISEEVARSLFVLLKVLLKRCSGELSSMRRGKIQKMSFIKFAVRRIASLSPCATITIRMYG